MKKLLVIGALAFWGHVCVAQNGIRVNVELEKLTFKEDPRKLIQGRRRSADRAEPMSTLPAYSVYDAKDYTFGPVKLDDECHIQFLLNSIEEKKIVGLVIWFNTEATSKAINTYILHKYRAKPIVLEKDVQELDNHNKPYHTGFAYLWRNVRPGVSMILSKSYNDVVKGKLVETSTLVFITDNVTSTCSGQSKSVFDRIIGTFTVKHDHD